MKPSQAPQKSSSAARQQKDRDDLQPEGMRPADAPPQQSTRPRLPPGRLSDISQELTEHGDESGQSAESADASDDNGGEEMGQPKTASQGTVGSGKGVSPASEGERLSTLKDAVDAKLLVQQRMRRSYGSTKQEGPHRVSPIKEEDAASSSPSQRTARSSESPDTGIMRVNSSMSTESTESTKTIRASAAATPAGNFPARTPSYPFPYVPGTPKNWSSQFHQPFMSLSPTTSAMPKTQREGQGDAGSNIRSGPSTPAANNASFLPPGTMSQGPEDLRYPTPNIYNMVLELNAEPGMEAWWATVTNLMHDNFNAERAVLVMPQDPTDIENVPWGQKATFSMNGPEEFVPHRTVVEQTSQSSQARAGQPKADAAHESSARFAHEERQQRPLASNLRPRLETRHSYAGPIGGTTQTFGTQMPKAPPGRPAGPQRTVTHAAGMSGAPGPDRPFTRRLTSNSTLRHGSISDPEFSSLGGNGDAGPFADVFESLRPIDHEVRPLIETSGVQRVLDRGRLVTVTRDYGGESSDGSSNANSVPETSSQSETGQSTPGAVPKRSSKALGNYRSVFASDNTPSTLRDYEEYEQYPASPWSQSPAPSPALQTDEETNPFFASEEQQVEDSFNPTTTPKDYTAFGQVEAIGVDHASTVIHIPLIHPTVSQPMQSLRTEPRSDHQPGPPKRSNTLDMERRAPIAVLSVLSSDVPYPHNLTQCLKLLGPHLATSLAIQQQLAVTGMHAASIRHRRTASGRNVSNAPMTVEPTSLEDIVHAQIEQAPGSFSGSVTSPSDYSGHSKNSPSGSLAGTPGWDPASHGWNVSRSLASTPYAATETVDNYFEAKKRYGQRSFSNTSAQMQTPPRQARKQTSSDNRGSATKVSPPGDEEVKQPQSERKPRTGISRKEEKSPPRPASASEHSPGRLPEPLSPMRPGMHHFPRTNEHFAESKRHSQLHSYGADFHASFGGLPSASIVEPSRPTILGHARKSSNAEDMPPPSERLLRTMIDSVPVQIFTAEPETGRLSWVNSKFLIYRGQEARQVRNDPWQAIHPDDRADFNATWNRSLRTAQQLQQKVRLERFDGSYRWFYVRAAPLKDKRQKIVHWIGTMMDFHEQHIAEANVAKQQETAASEAKYRTLANSSPQIVFAVNKASGVTFCNTQWLHFSGQAEAQALGVGFMDQVHPDDLGKCRLPTFDEGSNNPRNVPTSVPPNLRRKASASVESTAASSSGSSETEKGTPGQESSSPMTSHMPQRKLSELASTGILKVTRDADGRPSYSTEVRLKCKDGDYRWHLVRVLLAEPMLQSALEEETWYGTCTDINDHKTLERDLKETMDEKSRFLSNMSHEIRTPLNGITGMVNFLIDSSLTAEQMEHVNIIRASTEGLRGLINDILDLSKAEAGMIQLSLDWMYVRALIEEVNDLTSAMAIDKGLELNYIVEKNVPAQIKGDRFRIRQILLNIIGNAIKFTQVGEVFVRCSIQTGEEGELDKNELYVNFDVVDTGQGFTEKEANHLFKRFSQIDGSSTRQHGGTGLGLVISRQLAQLHGGDMSAKGAPGEGATFTFSIKTSLPSKHDKPVPAVPTPSGTMIPILPSPPSPAQSPGQPPAQKPTNQSLMQMTAEAQGKPSPRFSAEYTHTPSPYASSSEMGRDSPSSAGSDPSLKSAVRTNSIRSERSSVSSVMPVGSPPMKLSLPGDQKPPTPGSTTSESISTTSSGEMERASSSELTPQRAALPPKMYSILVLTPLRYSREATLHHIGETLPKNIPHQVTSRETLAECQQMISGPDPVIFSHIVALLKDVDEIVSLMDHVLPSPAHSTTAIVLITDLVQRRKIMEAAPQYKYAELAASLRLRFVFKPLKPSRFASIFDPQKEREMSTDRNHDSAQQVALTQKQVFDQVAKRLGNKDKRVLLVEDNRTNQLVVLKFLAKVSITAEVANDGVECTDKLFAAPPNTYSIILCDLHMPNKDGYQTCKEIRAWERARAAKHLPIIALSANVLGDVYQKCVEAGFNSYMTKPVEFKELSTVLMTFMDPSDPSKPHEFMKAKGRRRSVAPAR